jgi:hypothetical protein
MTDIARVAKVSNLLKLVWAVAWAAVLVVVGNSQALLGMELFGTPLWFGIIGARLLCVLISEGLFSVCGCSRDNKLRKFFIEMEHVYMVTPDGPHAPLGWRFMKQPVSRIIKYSSEWPAGRPERVDGAGPQVPGDCCTLLW